MDYTEIIPQVATLHNFKGQLFLYFLFDSLNFAMQALSTSISLHANVNYV